MIENDKMGIQSEQDNKIGLKLSHLNNDQLNSSNFQVNWGENFPLR